MFFMKVGPTMVRTLDIMELYFIRLIVNLDFTIIEIREIREEIREFEPSTR